MDSAVLTFIENKRTCKKFVTLIHEIKIKRNILELIDRGVKNFVQNSFKIFKFIIQPCPAHNLVKASPQTMKLRFSMVTPGQS